MGMLGDPPIVHTPMLVNAPTWGLWPFGIMYGPVWKDATNSRTDSSYIYHMEDVKKKNFVFLQ